MAQYWGYTDSNIVDVVTEDGYILQMHHIPYGRNGKIMRKNQSFRSWDEFNIKTRGFSTAWTRSSE